MDQLLIVTQPSSPMGWIYQVSAEAPVNITCISLDSGRKLGESLMELRAPIKAQGCSFTNPNVYVCMSHLKMVLAVPLSTPLNVFILISFPSPLFSPFLSTRSACRTVGCTRPMAVWSSSPSSCAASPSSPSCTGCTAATTASLSTACPSTCRCPPTWATPASWRRRSTGLCCSAERATVSTSAAAARPRLLWRPPSLTVQRTIDIRTMTARSSRTLSY